MGYYTYFTLEMYGPDDKIKKAGEDIKALSSEGYLNELVDYGSVDLKWYDWKEDIDKVAKTNPDVLIILYGDGEGSDDLWQYRVKGDISEFHSVEMPPFTTPELLIKE